MSTVAVKGLNCPNCGAAITPRSFQFAVSIVCDSCQSVLDPSDGNATIIERYEGALRRITPEIPLGSRGTWKGDPWEVIGFLIREIRVDDVGYRWREYLLFNPFRGFRYLSEYDGHWNDITVVRGTPRDVAHASHPSVEWRGTPFKLFQTATATTVAALGEFPWVVHVGDQALVQDYVAPPFILSREHVGGDDGAGEVTWSLGEYVQGERLRAAFGVKAALPAPRGTFANQPNPMAGRPAAYWKGFSFLVLLLIALFIGRRTFASDAQLGVASGTFHPGRAADTAAFIATEFTITSRAPSLELRTVSNVSNAWLGLGYSLVNDSTGKVINLGREVGYYYGTDSDGSWSEGSRSDNVRVSGVSPGKWFLRVEVDGPDAGPEIDWQVEVRQDVPGVVWWLLAFVVLLVPPIVVSLRSAAFETTRWAESDFAPVASDDSSDDSDE